VELALIIVALLVLGSLMSTGHALPQEIAALKSERPLYLPYTKEDVEIIYRIWATWRVERLTPHADALTQHFKVLKGTAPYYQTRKML
jgi:hypothetical protein